MSFSIFFSAGFFSNSFIFFRFGLVGSSFFFLRVSAISSSYLTFRFFNHTATPIAIPIIITAGTDIPTAIATTFTSPDYDELVGTY